MRCYAQLSDPWALFWSLFSTILSPQLPGLTAAPNPGQCVTAAPPVLSPMGWRPESMALDLTLSGVRSARQPLWYTVPREAANTLLTLQGSRRWAAPLSHRSCASFGSFRASVWPITIPA